MTATEFAKLRSVRHATAPRLEGGLGNRGQSAQHEPSPIEALTAPTAIEHYEQLSASRTTCGGLSTSELADMRSASILALSTARRTEHRSARNWHDVCPCG